MIDTSPFIIPIFIAHQGCPHQCVFCNQHAITKDSGQNTKVDAGRVQNEIDRCLAWPRDKHRQTQVAFYGGSFTGLPFEQQKELLAAVQPYIENGQINSIRLSTRPDYIDQKTASFLKKCNVNLVELGVQSMDQKVLKLAGRGHNRKQVSAAFNTLKAAGLHVGGQLMIGLPGETTKGVLDGAKQLAALQPDLVRIYPTLVISGSPLAKMYSAGEYRSMSLNRAVALCTRLKQYFDQQNIPVIRMGLHPSSALEKELVSGPYHPAFGELVHSRIFFRKMRNILKEHKQPRNSAGVIISLSRADQSQFQGLKKCNVRRLNNLHLLDGVEIVYSNTQQRGTIKILQD